MKQALSRKTVLMVLSALLIAAIVFLIVRDRTQAPVQEELTREAALALLEGEVVDGCVAEGLPEKYRSCTLTIAKEQDHWLVTVVHDGFFDDSVKASRVQVVVRRVDGAWVKGEITESYQCWPGRGHQDFSNELCV
jgi:hypothetical protein